MKQVDGELCQNITTGIRRDSFLLLTTLDISVVEGERGRWGEFVIIYSNKCSHKWKKHLINPPWLMGLTFFGS